MEMRGRTGRTGRKSDEIGKAGKKIGESRRGSETEREIRGSDCAENLKSRKERITNERSRERKEEKEGERGRKRLECRRYRGR